LLAIINMHRRLFSTLARKDRGSYDVAVVGGGHNALVAANYLARAGQKVVVVERRDVLGGAAITESLYPGFHYSRASYVYSLFRPHIAADLDLASKGLKLLRRLPSSFSPSSGAGAPSLTLGGGDAFDSVNIAQFSKRDVEAWKRYNDELEMYSKFARYLLDVCPPDIHALLSGVPFSSPEGAASWRQRLDALDTATRMGVRALQDLGPKIPDFLSFLTSPASKFLDRFFESPLLKATLATDAVIGAFVGPHTPTTGYVLLHHCMTGAWFNVSGGMGTVSQALALAAKENNVDFVTATAVKRIRVKESKDASAEVEGLELEDGSFIHAKAVFSGVAPTTTFVSSPPSQWYPSASSSNDHPLLPEASELLPPSVYSALKASDHRSAVMKINCAIDRLPQFKCKLPGQDATMVSLLDQHRRSIKPVYGEVQATSPTATNNEYLHLRGTIHFEESMDVIDKSYNDAKLSPNNIQLPNDYRPLVEMTIPSLLDPTIAPTSEGKHVALLFVQYAPYEHASNWTLPTPQAARDAFADKVFKVIDNYAPGFSSSVLHRDILTPVDLEGVFGLPGGNIFHSAMSLDQLFWSRPVAGGSKSGGFGSYRVPTIKGLYMCGAGTHPGGGVMGAAGHNAAIQYLKNERGWTRTKLAKEKITSSPWVTTD
jgi:phytoene dehydrogenase-like protein